VPDNLIPQSQAVINASTDPSSAMTEDFIDQIIDRWRGATMSKQNVLDGSADFEQLARDEFSTLSPQAPSIAPQTTISPQQPVYERRGSPPAPSVAAPAAPPAAPRLDPDRFRLLKKPLEGGSLGAGSSAPPPGAPKWPRS
jgi:hypothetical protein